RSGCSIDTLKHQISQVTKERSSFSKGNAVAIDSPQNRNQSHQNEALGHSGKHILLAHEAGIEQSEPWSSHHQNQSGRYKHPRIVGITLSVSSCRFQLLDLVFQTGGLSDSNQTVATQNQHQ